MILLFFVSKDPAKWNFWHSGCVVICFVDGHMRYIVGVRFIEPDITGLMDQAPTLRHSLIEKTALCMSLFV